MRLLEIPFINGYTEFTEHFSKEFIVQLGSTYSDKTYEIELDELKVLEKSLVYSFPEEEIEDLEVILYKKPNNKYGIKFISTDILSNMKVSVNYTYENTDAKYLYSIDYEKGIIYFSEPVDNDYRITYNADNLISTGKEARQMEEEEYNEVNKVFNIRNPKDNSSIFFLYKNDTTEHRNITPILQDIKVNYIIKDDLSLWIREKLLKLLILH